MKLSVVIPVFNEIDSINEIIKRVRATEFDKEIIIIDDYSTDGTREYLKSIEAIFSDTKILYHKNNLGKTAAVKSGIKECSGDIVIIQDADLEYNPQDYSKLIEPILNNKAYVAYGSRFLNVHPWLWMWYWFQNRFKGKHYEIRYLSHFLGIKTLNFLVRLLYGTKITDEATGYKIFRTGVIKNINLEGKGFEFCPEVTAKIIKAGFKIYEVPIDYHPRTIQQGKKIKWKDGLYAVWTLIKYKFITNGYK
jgi:glycosyltransferase involved in cell wall biosynthesis